MYSLCKADSDKAENSEECEYLHDDCVREYIFSEKKRFTMKTFSDSQIINACMEGKLSSKNA